ncbi:TPA: hypothetical protein ACGUU0_003203 [Vibrio vulnificus]|uniref:hypothetical protein n=1 Tax=Vibrio parahaemolyticus TaxID=670 RepID=UPI0004DF983F|nr:hypothetical protein [Vibrio parahaemolyticus]
MNDTTNLENDRNASQEQPQGIELNEPNQNPEELDDNELAAILKKQEKEIDSLNAEIQERLKSILDLDSLYESLRIDTSVLGSDSKPETPSEQITSPPSEAPNKQMMQTTIPLKPTPLKDAFVNFLNRRALLKANPETTANTTPSQNINDVLMRRESMGGIGKIKGLCQDTQRNIESLLSDELTKDEVAEKVKRIKTNITEINQDMQLSLKATQHLSGKQLDRAFSRLATDAKQLGKLADFIQKESSTLNVRNELLPEKNKIDFGGLAGTIRDSANKISELVKTLTVKLDPNSVKIE